MSSAVIGVVVVGAGIAGKVRIRDISADQSDECQWKMIGFVSRRKLEIEGATQLTEDEIFERADVHAVIVCTEPSEHERIIRKSLEHCKHVLVEFPVSTSAAVTKELYNLANQKGVVLHEENIALLTPGFLSMKAQISEAKSQIMSGEIRLSGSYNGWVENFNKSGGPFCANISLIESLYELIGEDVEIVDGKLDINDEGFTALATLTSSKCRKLSLIVKRTKEKSKREKQMQFILENGDVIEETPYKPPTSSPQQNNKPGLFMQDFLLFIDEIKHVKPFEHETTRSIRCMELADNIHHLMGLS